MIKKLKIKFVAITLTLVFSVLIGVFAVLLISTASTSKNEAITAMQRMASRDNGQQPPKFEFDMKKPPDKPFLLFPIFCVTLDENNEIEKTVRENIDVSDATVQTAVTTALQTQKKDGILSSGDLRFILIQTDNSKKLVFADRSNEHNAINTLLFNSVFVGMGSLVAFFFISLFLANRAIRPIALAWDRQRQFVADASHELKTPLTVILANTSILTTHKDDTIANQIKWIEHTQTEAEFMKKMVDDLLFLARSDAISTPQLYSRFSLTDEALSCLLPLEPVAYESGVTLELDIATDIYMTGDSGHIKQLMVILADNACKYAIKGSIIDISLLPYKSDKLQFIVKNHCDDIEKEDLQHIFERFYRGDKSRGRNGGYGLGLSIAKTIVDNHKGKITVQSSNGITKFTVTLSA